MSRLRDYETRPHETPRSENGRSVTELLKELRDEGIALFRQEVQLVKQEMSEKAARVGRNAGYLAAGAMLAYSGLVIVLLAVAALVYVGLVAAGLSHMMAGWLAPLIVGGVVLLIGFGMIKKAQHTLSKETAVPQHTADSMKENKQWAKEKVTHDR